MLTKELAGPIRFERTERTHARSPGYKPGALSHYATTPPNGLGPRLLAIEAGD
jgi:hypothetical protein